MKHISAPEIKPPIGKSEGFDWRRSKAVDEIREAKKRPDLSGWRAVLDSRPEGGIRVEVK